MSDFAPPAPDAPAPPPFPWEQAPRARRRRAWVIVLGLALVCLVVAGILFYAAQAGYGTLTGRAETRRAIDGFLKLLSNHEENQAYDLFSSAARKTTSLDDLKRENAGSGYQLVQGYRAIEVTAFELKRGSPSQADLPAGDYADVSGWILYDEKPAGRFHAILEREGNVWRLFGISISPTPDDLG